MSLSSFIESCLQSKLVSRALRFLSVVVKMGSHRDLFAAPETLRGFCERIILPNMAIRRELRRLPLNAS
jgi:exportin-2 (importin alpha re-exporter)